MSKRPLRVPLRTDLETAAELRAAGRSWDHVAREVRHDLAEVETWPRKYRDLWDPFFQAANRRLAAEAEAEGRAVLRQDLRQTDGKDRRDVAKKLVDHGRRTAGTGPAAPAPSDAQRLADELEGLSHDELRTRVEALLARLVGDGPEDPGSPGGR